MNNKIEFYIPEDQKIPTRLRLKKGNTHIYYERLTDNFGYEFELYNLDSQEQGEEIVREAATIMCNQSYNHGQEWRMVSIECIVFNDNSWGKSGRWEVEFRIKDSY